MQLKFTRALFAFIALLSLAALPSGFTGTHEHEAYGQRKPVAKKKAAVKPVVYSCPMDPEVKSKKPGRCPKCGMALRPVKDETPAEHEAHEKEGASDSGATPTPAAPTASSSTATPIAPNTLKIPDTMVYNQHGQKLNFYTDLVKGKTVAINFVFTTCTTICPPLTATFRKVQQELGDRVGRDIELISVSVDPTTDVPERLKEFSAKFKAAPGWSFVTGSKPEIDALLKALGAAVADKNDHTPMILIGNDAAGYWTRTYGLAPASTLVKVVNEAAAKTGATTAAGGASTGGDNMEIPLPQTTAAGTPAAAGAPVASQAGGTPKSAGGAAYFPNHVLLTQDNQPVRFYEDLLKGKVALINFMFTTCKGVCSPMTANLAKVQQQLGDRLGKEVVMLSFTVDQETDTPAVLKKYADSFKARPGWYFLTGKKENLDWVLYKLGGYVEDKNAHNLKVIIGNEATGEWQKLHAMANPNEIAAAVLKLLPPK
ncbi:MAG TPA: SCO family protein [Pyrinomonadaceae bacterium]|jgi:cytochrome oxidase Cu insertion factor (SCO1/SenC/PrrC family)